MDQLLHEINMASFLERWPIRVKKTDPVIEIPEWQIISALKQALVKSMEGQAIVSADFDRRDSSLTIALGDGRTILIETEDREDLIITEETNG